MRYPFLLLLAILVVGCLSACATTEPVEPVKPFANTVAVLEPEKLHVSFATMAPVIDEQQIASRLETPVVAPCPRFDSAMDQAEAILANTSKNYSTMLD